MKMFFNFTKFFFLFCLKQIASQPYPTAQCFNKLCATCQDTTQPACLTCDSTLHRIFDNGDCPCRNYYYFDYATKTCLACYYSCQLCRGPAITDCTSCNGGDFRTLTNQDRYPTCACFITDYDPITKDTDCQATIPGTPYKYCVPCQDYPAQVSSFPYCDDLSKAFFNGNQCTCKPGYFENGVQACAGCNSYCNTCTGTANNQCSSCYLSSHRELLGAGTCNCDIGHYDTGTLVCGVCHYSCTGCTAGGSDNCKSCNSSNNRKFSYGNTYTCPCQNGYNDNGVSAFCWRNIPFNKTECHYSCLQCSDVTPFNCTSCDAANHRTLQQYSATNQSCLCTSGYQDFGNALCGAAITCNYECLTCSDTTSSGCLSCSTANHRSKSGTTCPCTTGYFDDGADSLCRACNLDCMTCSDATSSDCLTCDSTTYRSISDNSCLCTTGYFENGAALCGTCDLTCLTCNDTTSSGCLTCDATNFRNLTGRSCKCAQNYFNVSGVVLCKACDYTCLTCSDAKNSTCLTCDVLNFRNISGKSCPCTQDYFDSGGAVCAACDQTCLTCNDTTSSGCLTCDPTDFRSISLTSCLCIAGYFDNDVSSCATCDVSCLTCIDGTDSGCLTCNKANFRTLQLNSCPCNSAYFDPGSAICLACHITCQTCINTFSTGCSQCLSTNFRSLYENQCPCLPGYFDTGIGVCGVCDLSCLNCTNTLSTGCLQCDASNFRILSQNQCICQPGYFENKTAICALIIIQDQISCDYSCQTCTDTSNTSCSTCAAENFRVFSRNSCQCDQGYFDTGSSICGVCDLTCYTCSDTYNSNCMSCDATNLRYFFSGNNTCLCNQGYKDIGSQTCVRNIVCDVTCQTCQDSTISGCLTCNGASPFFRTLSNKNMCQCIYGYKNSSAGTCVPQNCAISQYFDQVYQKCEACQLTCQTCSGPSKLQCLSCFASSSRGLQDGQCYCPTNYLSQDDLGTCTQSCLTNQLQIGGQCFNCHPLCSECSGLSPLDCTACQLDHYDELNTNQNQPQYYQNSPIYLSLNVKSYICQDSSSEQVKVSVHLDSVRIILTATNINTNQTDFSQTFDNLNFVIPKQSLQSGNKYLINLEVQKATQRILQDDKQQQKGIFKASFQMEIIHLDKLISITGGNRLIGNSENLVINSELYDFNQRDTPIQDLWNYNFTWSCNLVASDVQCLNNKGQYLETSSITQNLVINVTDLAPLNSYEFQVYVYDLAKQRIYNTSVIYQVVDQNIPSVNVTFDSNILAIPVNLNIQQQFEFIYQLQINPDNLFYSANLLYNFDIVATIIYHYPAVNFRIWDYFLNFSDTNGTKLYFNGQVYNPLYLIPSLFTLSMNVNIPPQMCQIFVSPNSGVELTDLFLIQVLKCQDSSFVFSYRFAYYQSQSDYDHDTLQQSLARASIQTSFQQANLLNTYFPKGIDGSNIILVISVKDNLGGISNYTQTVQVTRIQIINEETIIGIINNISDIASQLIYSQVVSASLINLNQTFPVITPLIIQILSEANNTVLSQEQQNQVTQIQAFTSTQTLNLGSHISSQQLTSVNLIQQITDSIAYSKANPSRVLNQQTHDILINLNIILDNQQILGSIILQNLISQQNSSIDGNSTTDKNSTQFLNITSQNQQVLEQLNQSRLIKIQQMTPNDGTKLLISKYATSAVALTTQKILSDMMGKNIIDGSQAGFSAQQNQSQTNNIYTFTYLQLSNNPYTSNLNYPYADQGFSVIDLQITNQTGQQITNSDLQKSGNIVPSQQISFNINQKKIHRLLQAKSANMTVPKSNISKVCVSLVRNQWSAEECQTLTTKGQLSCLCNTINPTSAVLDFKGLFSGANTQIFSTPALGQVAKFPWQRVTLYWIIVFITVVYLIMLPIGFKRDKNDKINKDIIIQRIRQRNMTMISDPFCEQAPQNQMNLKIKESNLIEADKDTINQDNLIIEVELQKIEQRNNIEEEEEKRLENIQKEQILNQNHWIEIKQNQRNQFKFQGDLGTIITTPSSDRQYDFIVESPSYRNQQPDQTRNNEKSQLEQLEKEKNANMTFIQYFLIHHTYLNIYNSYEDLNRPIRASLIYLALLQSLAVTLYFGSSLTIVRSIILGVLCSVASTINITLLKALLSSKFMALRIFGFLLFTSLAGFMIFVILAVIATTESIAQTNVWSIQYSSSIVYDGTIGSITLIVIKYKFFR